MAGSRGSFALTKSKSFYVKQMKVYLKENWVNLVVLGVIVALSAASSGIIYQYATDSISSVSSEMLTVTLGDIKNRVSSYLSLSIAVVPAAKGFLTSMTLATGNNVTHAEIRTASKMWGYFFEATKTYANSLFYLDYKGNDLGWGAEPDGSSVIITYWPSAFSGFNTYIPVNGAIQNISEPRFSNNITLVFPPLDIARQSGKPYWAPVFLLRIGPTDVMPLFTYVEPGYYEHDGSFCCVVGTNIYVRSFASVLSSYQIGENAKIFIADDKGTLIADSQNGLELFLKEADEGDALNFQVLPNATQNPDPVLASAARYLVRKYGSFGNIPAEDQKLQFKHKGSNQILLVGQYSKDNLKIYIAIVVPYSTFFSGITTSRHITISLTIIAVVCGVVRYLFAFRMMASKKNKNAIVPTRAFDSTSTVSSSVSSTVSISVATAHGHASREGSTAALVPEEPTKTPVSYFN